MDIATIATIVGTVAAIVALPPAYLALRKKSDNPKRASSMQPSMQPGKLEGGPYDAFISYAPQDSARAIELAEQLKGRGIRVFLAEWIEDGLIETLEKEKALLGAANGILVFSAATMANPATQADYAALLNRVNESGGRFVPVLLERVTLPPFAAIRRPADLTDPASPGYDARVDRLAKAVGPAPLTPGTTAQSP
jgi:hypothetical protein